MACSPPVNEDGIARRTVREIEATFDDIAKAELALSPETATRLGMREARLEQPFQTLLDDRSQARFERTRLLRLEILSELNALPAVPENSGLGRHLDIIRAQYEDLTRLEAYGFGRYEPGLARPYAVDQMSGAWVDVPDLLIAAQPLVTHADAEAYLERLAALPDALADEQRRLQAEAKTGMIPPRFVLERLEARLRAFAALPVDAHPLLQTFGNVVGGLKAENGRSPNAYRAAAARLILTEVSPAYLDFAEAVGQLKQEAPETPGVWTAENGKAWYSDVLAFYTQPDADPAFWHAEGLSAVSHIETELDAELRTLGLDSGTVAERLRILGDTPGEAWSNDAEGRKAILERMRGLTAQARTRLADMLDVLPEAGLVITRMPPYREAAFSSAAYVPATADGRSPALLQINLSDTGDWPAFALPTVAFHEGIPGHHVESTLASRRESLPLLRQMIWDTAYGEGWAVYAEDLADEFGLYDTDPLGRIGYLQSILLRAARLVVDTGIHDRQWSYEEAVSYLTETTGLPREAMEREVARYAVWPGQASAYYIGRKRILDMRTRAEAVLGGRFDPSAFNTVLLTGGPRPLPTVEADVEAWYGALLQR